MTVLQDLDKIGKIKVQIYNEIKDKSVNIPANTPFEEYPNKIKAIPSSSGVDLGNIRNVVDGSAVRPTAYVLSQSVTNLGDGAFSYLFYEDTTLTSADMSSLTDISGENACYYMFRCYAKNKSNLTTLDLSGLTNVSGKNSLKEMCRNCSKLTTIDLSNLTTISGESAFDSTFYGCTSLKSIDLSSVVSITGPAALYATFVDCSNLESIDLSGLTTVSGSSAIYQTFNNCSKLKTVNLSSLTSVSGYRAMNETFKGLPVENVDLSSLTTISGGESFKHAFSYTNISGKLDLSNLTTLSSGSDEVMYDAFYNTAISSVDLSSLESIYARSGMKYTFESTNLTSVEFPKLAYIAQGALQYTFRNCTHLTSVSFPALTSNSFADVSVLNNMLQGVTGCTVHFPAALQSVIGNWTSVANGFGGTNTTVLFDIVQTQQDS